MTVGTVDELVARASSRSELRTADARSGSVFERLTIDDEAGPVCWHLCWYLALNRERLPETKEAAIERLREALEHRGAVTSGWWERQLDLCVVGIVATFGWEKALGDDTSCAGGRAA